LGMAAMLEMEALFAVAGAIVCERRGARGSGRLPGLGTAGEVGQVRGGREAWVLK